MTEFIIPFAFISVGYLYISSWDFGSYAF